MAATKEVVEAAFKKFKEDAATKEDVEAAFKRFKEDAATKEDVEAAFKKLEAALKSLTVILKKAVPALASTIAEGAVLPKGHVYWGARATFTVFRKQHESKSDKFFAVGSAHCVLYHPSEKKHVWAFLPSDLTNAGVVKVGFADELCRKGSCHDRRHDWVVVRLRNPPAGITPINWPSNKVPLDDSSMTAVGGAAAAGVVLGRYLQAVPEDNINFAKGTFTFFLEVGEGGCSGTALYDARDRFAGVFYGCLGAYSEKDNYRGLCVPIPQLNDMRWATPCTEFDGLQQWRDYSIDFPSSTAKDSVGESHHGVLLAVESHLDGSTIIGSGYLCGDRAS
eukprot:762354-Amphidinium_carterae.1